MRNPGRTFSTQQRCNKKNGAYVAATDYSSIITRFGIMLRESFEGDQRYIAVRWTGDGVSVYRIIAWRADAVPVRYGVANRRDIWTGIEIMSGL